MGLKGTRIASTIEHGVVCKVWKQYVYISLHFGIQPCRILRRHRNDRASRQPETNEYRGVKMKKLITLSLMFAGLVFVVPQSEAKAATGISADPQVRLTIGSQRNNRWRNRRIVTRTRIVRSGFRTYRETIRTTYLPNGRTRTQVIRRERVRG